MFINCDFKNDVEKMKNFFINNHNFICVENKETDDLAEYQLHLINQTDNVHIDLIKYPNDNDVDITLNGSPELLNKYSLYVDFFLNKQKLLDAGLNDLVEEINEEVKKYE